MKRLIAMNTSTQVLFSFFLVSIQLFAFSLGQFDADFPLCSSNNTYAENSTFEANLDFLTYDIISGNASQNGFYNLSYGQNPDQVNVIAMCRGDLDPDSCLSCIDDAIGEVTPFCFGQKEGITWYEECMFRYSDRPIFGKMELEPSRSVINDFDDNVTDATQFNEVLTALLDGLRTKAALGDSLRKVSTGDAAASDSQIYAVAQCTPDLSEADCNECISKAIESLPQCCSGKQGAKFYRPSCFIRYDNYNFYDSPNDFPTLSALSPADTGGPAYAPSPLSPPDPVIDEPEASPPVVDVAPASPPSELPVSPPPHATVLPPVVVPPPPPFVPAIVPPPSSIEAPAPSPFLETPPPPPPPFLDLPPEFAPPSFVEPPELSPPPEPVFESYPPLLPPDENDTGKGNMNSGFQALATVVLLMILQSFAF